MAAISEKEFVQGLAEIADPDDDVLLIFSGIWAFAGAFGASARDLPDRILDLIEDFVGSDRTLLFPSYNYSFPKTRSYDPVRSKPETGLLADRYLKRAGVRRTLNPMESYLVKGPKAGDVLSLACTTGWGDDGVMGWLEAMDARVLVLGMPWEYCGFYHRSEEVARVPYRYFKRFHGTMSIDGIGSRRCSETMYVRSLDVPPVTDVAFIRNLLAGEGHARHAESIGLPMVSNKARAITKLCVEVLRDRPYAYVRNRSDVGKWVETGKAQEIGRLAPEQIPEIR